METTTSERFSGLVWNKPRVRLALPHGRDAEELYILTEEVLETQLNNNQYVGVLRYEANFGQIRGSNLFVTGLFNMALEPYGLRSAVPSDDVYGDVSRAVYGEHFTDFNAAVVRENRPSLKRNEGLWKRIIELSEQTLGRVEFPFMVEGFKLAQMPEDFEGYGLTIVPAKNLRIIPDQRLSAKYYGERFNSVDDIGLPVFEERGKRIFYSGGEGLSRLNLYYDLDLCSDYWYLDGSYGYGRVVVVSAEGTRAKQ